jgi:hypothetical protein
MYSDLLIFYHVSYYFSTLLDRNSINMVDMYENMAFSYFKMLEGWSFDRINMIFRILFSSSLS